MDTRTALAVATLLVISGAFGGAVASSLTRPAPPSAALAVARATASAAPSANPETSVFAQPLSAGCATEQAVWVVSDGGGIARFADERWSLVDGTLRSLVAASCAPSEMIAVGPGGRLLVADDATRSIRVDTAGIESLGGVAVQADGGALAVGTGGTVLSRTQGWSRFAQGIDEDLHGVGYSQQSGAWIVGAQGAAYRLEDRGWHSFPAAGATLNAVAPGVDDVLAVGDSGALLRWKGGWSSIATGTAVALRGVARTGSLAYVVGDGGQAFRLDLATARLERIDLGTACPIRAVWLRGTQPWFVASSGARAAVWRIDATGLKRWGEC